MALDVPLQYPNYICSIWKEWCETRLDRRPPPNTTFEELSGAITSDTRTRALEYYRIGFLKGRLVNPRAGRGSGVPGGMKLLANDETPISTLGYLAYGVAKTLEVYRRDPLSEPALHALCAVILLQVGFHSEGHGLLLCSLFDYMLEQASRHGTVSRPEQLLLAAAMMTTLHGGDRERLVAAFVNDQRLDTIRFKLNNGSRNLALSRLANASTRGDFRGAQFSPPRTHNFWIGTDDRPFGIFTLATKVAAPLIRAVRISEQRELHAGRPSPFESLFIKPIDTAPDVVTELISVANRNSEIKIHLEFVMKTLYRGVLESLGKIAEMSEGGLENVTLYAHGDVSGSIRPDGTITVRKDSCDITPQTGMEISVTGIRYRIRSVTDTGSEYVITPVS